MSVPIPVQSGTAMSGAGGALGAMVQLGNLIYTIIKDHGHELKLTSSVAGKGLSTVPEGMPVTITKRYEHGSAWYTHTRAWHAAIHSLYKHDQDKVGGGSRQGKDLSSTYLCIVFPFKVTYAVAEPNLLGLKEQITKMEVDITAAKLKAKEELRAKLKEQRERLAKDDEMPKAPDRPVKPPVVDKPDKPDRYRTPEQRQQARRERDKRATPAEAQYELDLDDYERYLVEQAQYEKDMKKYRKDRADYDLEVASIEDARKAILALAPASDEHIKAQIAQLDHKKDFYKKVRKDKNVKYMTDVRIQAADGFNGLKSTSWQNVKVEAKMELSGNEPVEGGSTSVTVALNWAEKVPGYGKAWTGTITLSPGSQDVKGEGKFLERFKRYALLQEVSV